MNIPNLPTDNLYKFLSLTGLFLMVSSFGYKEYRNHQHNIENSEIIVNKEILDYKIENKKRLLELSGKLSDIEIDIIESKKNYESKDNANLDIENLINIYKTTIKESDLEWYNIEAGKLRMKSELADVSLERTQKLNWMLNLSMIIGLISMVSGFYLWYIKLQRYLDIILLRKSNISETEFDEEKENE